jgi:bleomycin hydrolase
VDDYVCLVHDPRPGSPMGATFTVEYLGNVLGAPPVTYLNTEMSVIKELTARSLQAGEPVWFGCDVGKMMSSEYGLWDASLFDFSSLYDTAFTMDKSDRLLYHESQMTHAMLFTGVDLVDGTPRRWRVENSWGASKGQNGFYTMNDSWFDQYVFEIAARRSELPDRLRQALDAEPVVLPAWDPMGALAR